MSPTRPIEHVPLLGTKEHLPRVVDEVIFLDRTDVRPEKDLLLVSWVLLDSSSRVFPRDRSVLFRPPQFSPVRPQGAPPDKPF